MGLNVTLMGSQIKEVKREVKKHVATIHCANTISLLQRKVSNALLYHAYPALNDIEVHEITVKQLCSLVGYSGHNYQVIKDALKGLISTVIEWNVTDQQTGEEDWSASSILASVRIKGSHCFYSYSPRMRELLYTPVMYGKINLAIQARFNSSYGLALYENCVRYKGLVHTKWFDMESFRKLMGVPENSYPIFRDFKKRVLDKSVDEVNTYSDMLVTPEINRVGRKVVSIRFALKEREKKKKIGVLNNSMDEELFLNNNENLETTKILQENFGLSEKQVHDLFKEYPLNIIKEKIVLTQKSASFIQGKIKNLAAFFMSALKNDYKDSKGSQEVINVMNKANEEDHQLQNAHAKVRKLQEQHYEEYVVEKFDEKINAINRNELEKLLSEFGKKLKGENNSFVYNKFCENGLDDKLVKLFFRNYIREKYPKLAPEVVSFDSFAEINWRLNQKIT